MTEFKMYWLNESDQIDNIFDDIETFCMLKDYKIGRRSNPKRFYIVSKDSAEYVIKQIRKAGYTVREITNYD